MPDQSSVEARNNGEKIAENPADFRTAAAILIATLITCLLAEYLHNLFAPGFLSFAVPGLLLAGVAGLGFRYLKVLVGSPFFTGLTLLAIAAVTALGALLPRASSSPAGFSDPGEELDPTWLSVLQLDDVFHSWWYVGLFVLLAAGLIRSSWKRPYIRSNMGFHLVHLGPLLLMAGAWVDASFGFRGIIHLEAGSPGNTAAIYAANSSAVTDSLALDFWVRLDSLAYQRYDPDYRIQIWKSRGSAEGAINVSEAHGGMEMPVRPELLATVPLDTGRQHEVFGTGATFQLATFYPNFVFDYRYEPPSRPEAYGAPDPGALLRLTSPLGQSDLTLYADRPGQNLFHDPNHLGASLEFMWEPSDRLLAALEGKVHPDWATGNRILIAGADPGVHYVQDGKVRSLPVDPDAFYPFPGDTTMGFRIRHIFPDASWLKPVPATDGDKPLKPVARVEVRQPGKDSPEEVFLYPGRGGWYQIPETAYFLTLGSLRDRQVRLWRTDLSLLLEDGRTMKQGAVRVNEPMYFWGYRLYPFAYDPARPDQAGIGISRMPGLPLFYLGCLLTFAGCLLVFYGRSGKRASSEQQT